MLPSGNPLIIAPKFYAVQLSNSEHRKWTEKDNSGELIFQWNEIETEWNSKLEDIYIAVAKSHPTYSSDKIKSIARGIKTFPSLKIGTGVLGVSGKYSVKQAGVVTYNSAETRYDSQVRITVQWNNEIFPASSNSAVFDDDLEIQNVGIRILNKLNLPVLLEQEYNRSEAFNPPFENLIHPAISYKSEDESEDEPKDDKGGKISLFFGTNRNDTGLNDTNDKYGDQLSELKYGICEVTMPKGHIQGEIERPVDLWVYEFPEKETRHVILKTISELSQQDFFTTLFNSFNKLSVKSAMVFIHGYNTSFADAARRTAQIAWDVPFNGIAGFYSWPSAGKTLQYLSDIEKADASISALEEFIEGLIEKTGVECLQLVAHSMGNRILTASLNNLSDKQELQETIHIIQQIILAAPDIDQDVFNSTILPRLSNVGTRRTLYSSDKDNALKWSENFRNNRPRLGDAGSDLFVKNGIDTIDASNIKSSGNNHSYIFDTKELLNDLFFLMNKGLAPGERRLRERKRDTLAYWLFPK